jgi:hypothetical protein
MKLIKFVALGTAATALGWAIVGVATVVYMARYFEQADLDDEEGAFMPQAVLDRHRLWREQGPWN